MKMGQDTIEDTQKMFAVSYLPCFSIQSSLVRTQELECKVSISLDAWTSSNQHAFLALVAHYITNDGNLGMSPSIDLLLVCLLYMQKNC
jgi:hypothetical protein